MDRRTRMRSRMRFGWRPNLWSAISRRRSRRSCPNFTLTQYREQVRMHETGRGATVFLWTMVAIYGVARLLQLCTNRIPMLVVLGMHILPALAFALVHGGLRYRLRNTVSFILLFLFIGSLIENVGVAT